MPFPDLGAIRFLRARDFGDTINATFAFLRENARELITAFIAITGPLYIGSGILSQVMASRIEAMTAPTTEPSFDMIGEFAAAYVWILLLGTATGVVAQAAVAGYVRLYRAGEAGSITVGQVWDEARPLLGPILGLTLAVGLGLLVTGLINVIPCLGQLAWAAVVIWALPVISVMLATRVLETDSIGEAWERARLLVKGSWGRAFGVVFVTYVLFVVASMALAIPGGVLAEVVGANTTGGEGARWVLGVVLSPLQLLTGIAYLIPLAAAFFLHGTLVEDLEGSSLDEGLDALADTSSASRWAGEPVSTPPDIDDPRPTPPAGDPRPDEPAPPDADGPADSPSGGFRGGGFRDAP